jgi:LysR family transcriptional regulator, glycine cleavage system transcriptional activator
LAALRAFQAKARLGGIARAAAELNITTSAISHQLRRLEESLGTLLLERCTGPVGIRVTAIIRRQRRPVLVAFADIRGTTRRLTVSANVPLSTMLLGQGLAEFATSIPRL